MEIKAQLRNGLNCIVEADWNQATIIIESWTCVASEDEKDISILEKLKFLFSFVL